MRKLLGLCSLAAFAHASPERLLDPASRADALSEYVDHASGALRATWRSSRAESPGNSYGESVLELALALLFELQARPADWEAFAAAVDNEHQKIGAFWDHAGGEAILRKKVNDMYAVLRDKVDSDNYQAACGRSCSPNKIYAYRMLDTAYGDIAAIFEAWRQLPDQVAAILGRDVSAAAPIEVRQMKSIAGCKPEWVIRWSESRERFTGAAGPLHTRSKRFASLKNSPDKIGAMLREIGDYEELSSNRDCEWRQDAVEASGWLDDLARVFEQSEQADSDEADRILPAPAESLSLALRYISLPVRLAVFLKMLGAFDDTYPVEWLDPATGELPTMQQLAALEQVSLPTLRKRRDAAIDALLERP